MTLQHPAGVGRLRGVAGCSQHMHGQTWCAWHCLALPAVAPAPVVWGCGLHAEPSHFVRVTDFNVLPAQCAYKPNRLVATQSTMDSKNSPTHFNAKDFLQGCSRPCVFVQLCQGDNHPGALTLTDCCSHATVMRLCRPYLSCTAATTNIDSRGSACMQDCTP